MNRREIKDKQRIKTINITFMTIYILYIDPIRNQDTYSLTLFKKKKKRNLWISLVWKKGEKNFNFNYTKTTYRIDYFYSEQHFLLHHTVTQHVVIYHLFEKKSLFYDVCFYVTCTYDTLQKCVNITRNENPLKLTAVVCRFFLCFRFGNTKSYFEIKMHTYTQSNKHIHLYRYNINFETV